MPAAKVTTTVDDQSLRVQSTSTYNTAIVIAAPKGPIDTPIKVSGQTDFLKKFTPNERYELSWDPGILEAYKYLDEESGLYVVRCAHVEDEMNPDSVVKSAGAIFPLSDSSNEIVSFKNSSVYPTGLTYKQATSITSTGNWNCNEQDACIIYVSSPGLYGNDISAEIVTDEKQVKLPGAFLVKVYNKDELKETFTCSLDPSLKSGYGVNCSMDKVLSGSNYIRGFANPDSDSLIETIYKLEVTVKIYESTGTDSWSSTPSSVFTREGYTKISDLSTAETEQINDVFETSACLTPLSNLAVTPGVKYTYTCKYGTSFTQYKIPKAGKVKLSGGSDGDKIDRTSDRIRALKTLGNMNDINIQLVLDGGVAVEEYQNAIRDLCKKRKESCHGIICTSYNDEVNSDPLTTIRNYRKYKLNMNSYSMEMYTPHQKYYDEFNNREVWLSPGPYVAALIMKTARERGWHWAVAGYNRGIVPSLDVANPFEMEIVDELSDMQVNTIIKDPGSGNVIWDELTLWNQAADLQDAHISRWVNIYVRPALEEMLKSFLFEFNDEETRNLIIKKIETFMEPQKSARACYAYRVVCSEENNTPDDIENNRLNCWLYIKPTKLAKWINQKIIITPYAANLENLEI